MGGLLLMLLWSLSASSVLSQSPYYNSQVDLILSDLSHFLEVDNTSKISLPESYTNYLLVTLDLQNGYLTNVSTIHRNGNVNYKKLASNSTIMLSFEMGFDNLELFFPVVDFYVLGMTDKYRLNMSVGLVDVQVALGIMLSPTFHNCTYYINVINTVVGSYNVQLYDRGSIKTDTVVSFLIDGLLTLMSSYVETYLSQHMQPVLNAGLAQVHSTQVQTDTCSKFTTIPPTITPKK